MPIINRIAEYHDEMTAWRRDIHMHPEIGFEETRTAALVAGKLREFGVDEVVTGIAKTGVVGVIRGQGRNGGASGKAIGLRADMDALPMQEETGLPHASKIPGMMHACGHDGHTTMLLGAAKYLAETRNFDGTVYVIFQPAEESLGGGREMVAEKLFERFPMQRVFGMHNWPGAPEGEFWWRDGPVMAAVANLDVTITGTGAHGALPHTGNDPIVIAAQIVTALQSIVARNVEPVEAGVITIGHINGGSTWNIIPETVKLMGTARWFKPEVGDLLEKKFCEICHGIAAAFGAKAEVNFVRAYPATVNETESTSIARAVAEQVVGTAKVKHMEKPTMGGEDFSFMLNACPGNYIMIGGARKPGEPNVHNPAYDFNDAVLPTGASYWAMLAERMLPK